MLTGSGFPEGVAPTRLRGVAHPGIVVVAGRHGHQPFRLRNTRQWTQNQRVDDGENRRVRADPQGQGKRRDDGNGGRGGEGADGESQIAPEIIDDADAERIAILLFDLVEASELESHSADGLGIVKSGLLVRVDLTIDMEPQFFIDLAIDRGPAEQRSDPKKQVVQHRSFVYAVSSTRAIAAVSFRQALVSASS